MASAVLSVSFRDASGWHTSRYFRTLRASRSWARWLGQQAYVAEVAIHRGGPGGERVA